MEQEINVKERIDRTIAKIEQLREQSKFDLYGKEYEDIISEYGANELMILGCKLCKTPTGVKHIEIPYHGISKRRLDKAVENLDIILKSLGNN